MAFRNPILGGGGSTLLRPAIQSPNYVPHSAGWAVKRNGSAEFNDLEIRGTFLGTDFILNSSGLFVYAAAPALGNLIASISPAAGTDGFGNTYFEGVVSYSGAAYMGLAAANLLLGIITDPTNAAVVGLSGVTTLFLSSPMSTGRPDSATIALVDGDDTVTPRSSANYPHVDVGAASAGVTGWMNGAWIRSTVSGGVSTPETWQTPSYNANWSGTTTFGGLSGGLGTLRYRMDVEDNVHLLGTFVAAAGAGSAVFNLPAAYRPKSNYAFPVAFISSGGVAGNAWMYVSSAGNLNINAQLGSAVTTGTAYTINAKIPLGNVA